MKPRVYLETTIPSYLTTWPSRDLIRAAHQQLTREWWDRRAGFDLFISRSVVTECRAGDPDAAAARMAALVGLPLLEQSEDVGALAEALVRGVPLPPQAAADALHIATAAVHGMDYLVTWNCAHIANVILRPRIEALCQARGHTPPLILYAGRISRTPGGTVMIEDDIIREIRATREAFAAANGYDVRAMAATLREMDRLGSERVVRLSPKPVATPPPAAADAPPVEASPAARA